jgi:hypothetical protein
VEMQAGPALNLLGANLRALAAAALTAVEPSLCAQAAWICWRRRLLQGPQSGRVRVTGNRR